MKPWRPSSARHYWPLPRVLPAESVTCGDHDGLLVSDRDYPRVLLPSSEDTADRLLGQIPPVPTVP
jgi:hypothetical protein